MQNILFVVIRIEWERDAIGACIGNSEQSSTQVCACDKLHQKKKNKKVLLFRKLPFCI